jgi:putative redox protein
MDSSITLFWLENMAFNASIDSYTVTVDSPASANPLGPSPKSLLMVSLAGCTAMDVVSILQKMHVPFTHFSIDVHGHIADEHPKKYLSILLDYKIDTGSENLEKVEKAITLSKEKYCGVWNTLAPAVPIDYKITLL